MGRENLDYDCIVVGGGINGAGAFRDLALHGVKTLLLEKGDFSGQTSAKSSKMLHGGIRYLEQLEFSLIHEALSEKNLWLNIAPQLCYSRRFYLPVYKQSKYPLMAMAAGVKLYDALSFFKNIPSGLLSKTQIKEKFPLLQSRDLSGAVSYHDAIVDDTKMTLECIYDGLKTPGNQALNYHEVVEVRKQGSAWCLKARKSFTGETIDFTAKNVIFTTGPFTDFIMEELKIDWRPRVLPSVGAHLWFSAEKLPLKHPMVLQLKQDNRVIFVIPQKNHVLVGTTERLERGSLFDLKVTNSETDYLLNSVNYYFPGLGLSEKDIIHSISGVRPLVLSGGTNQHQTSRRHAEFSPSQGLHIILGGKYTTFRVMVQEVCRRVVQSIGKSYDCNKTLMDLRQHSVLPAFVPRDFDESVLRAIATRELARTSEDFLERRIGRPNIHRWTGSGSLADAIDRVLKHP